MATVLVKLLMALPQKPRKKQLKGGCIWYQFEKAQPILGRRDGTQLVAHLSEG